mgnify:FL=1
MFHDINFSLSSVGALLLFYIAEQMGGTSQRIDRANAARGGMVCARWWAFHAAAAPKTPHLLELMYHKGESLRTPRSILTNTQEQSAHSRSLSTPNGMHSANDTRERLTTDHTRRHPTRALLSPMPKAWREKTTPPRRMKGFVGAVWKVLAHNAPKRSEKFALSRGDRPALRASIRRTGAR